MGSVPEMIIKVAGESLREPRLVLLEQCLKCEPLHHALLLWRPAQICCCVAGSALPPDDEVPCMVNMCFVNCFPRLGICVSLGDMPLGQDLQHSSPSFLGHLQTKHAQPAEFHNWSPLLHFLCSLIAALQRQLYVVSSWRWPEISLKQTPHQLDRSYCINSLLFA